MIRKFIFIFFLFTLISCNQNYNTITTKDFSIRLPRNLISFKGQMLDSALLEYADTTKSIYVIVESEKLETPENSLDSARKQLVDFYLIDDTLPNSFIISQLNDNTQIIEAETAILEPDLTSTQTYWVVGFFRAKPDKYYIVWTWTNRIFKPDNEQTLKKIVQSFKLKQQAK